MCKDLRLAVNAEVIEKFKNLPRGTSLHPRIFFLQMLTHMKKYFLIAKQTFPLKDAVVNYLRPRAIYFNGKILIIKHKQQ